MRWVAGLLVLCAPGLALAAAPAPAAGYEDDRLARVLEAEGLTAAAEAGSAPIEFVRIVRHPVFTPHDPWPDVFNVFHWLTRTRVVTRELLLGEGDVWDGDLAEESARILRSLAIFSLVRVVPVTDADGRFGMLVFTRDLWSLRLEQDFQVTGSVVDNLLLQLTERNLFGLNKMAIVRFRLRPDTWSVGQVYLDRRVGGSAVTLGEAADLFIGRESGRPEGVGMLLRLGVPLRSFDQRWGWDGYGSGRVSIVRQLQGRQVLAWDDPATPEEEAIPRAWHQRLVHVSLAAQRQAGRRVRHRLAGGLLFDEVAARPTETGLPAPTEAAFRAAVLPTERHTLMLFASHHLFDPSYEVYEDLDTFGQSETARLGPSVSLVAGAGLAALGSSSDTAVLRASAGWVAAPAGALLRLETGGSLRFEDGDWVDRTVVVSARAATPPLGFGRLVAWALWEGRDRDTSGVLVSVGGHNGLRGYPSQAFFVFGGSRLRAGVELRTPPLVWRSLHLGATAFYDVGSVYERVADLEVHHGAGLGLRLLFPQFNRLVYRVDLAAPLDGSGFTVLLGLASDQAAPVRRAVIEGLEPETFALRP